MLADTAEMVDTRLVHQILVVVVHRVGGEMPFSIAAAIGLCASIEL